MKRQFVIIVVLLISIFSLSLAEDMLQKIIVTPENPTNSFDIQLWLSKGDGATYISGENLTLSFRTTKNAYVVLYDIQSNGSVNIIFPNRYDQDNFVYADTTYTLPRGGYNFTVDTVTGMEYIQAVASTEQFVNFNQWQQAFTNSVYPSVSLNAEEYFGNFNSRISVIPNPEIQWTSAITSFNVRSNSNYNGYLSCTSYPSGAEIWVDGRYTGRKTPTSFTLNSGNHLIRYVINQTRENSRYVNITPGQVTNLFMDMLH